VTAPTIDATADSPLEGRLNRRAPLLRQGWQELVEISRFRPLVHHLVSSSLRTENAGTVFGFLWWLLDPLLLMVVYVFLIDVILRRGTPDYPVFVLTAVIAWTFFAGATRTSIGQTLAKERLMRQVSFPKAVIPLAATTAEACHFVFGLAVLTVFAIPFGIVPHPVLPFVLVVAAVQLVLTLGVAYLLSALNVFFRDTQHLAVYFFRLWFYLSPALYALADVPPRFRDVYALNPFTTLFTSYRAVLIEHTLPDLSALALVAAGSVLVLVVGYLFFSGTEHLFTKLI